MLYASVFCLLIFFRVLKGIYHYWKYVYLFQWASANGRLQKAGYLEATGNRHSHLIVEWAAKKVYNHGSELPGLGCGTRAVSEL